MDVREDQSWRKIDKNPGSPESGRRSFRSDAKAAKGRALVGGRECNDGTQTKKARWWYLEVNRADFQCAFAKGNDPQRVIATLELLGILLFFILINYRSTNM